MKLIQLDYFPDQLLHIRSDEIYKVLEGPTLIHLPGKEKKRLFCVTLLHGNETTGFYAIQKLLKQYKNQCLPRALSIFIGNIEAAKSGVRTLDSQEDYNRIWDSEDNPIVQAVKNEMNNKPLFAMIDIHNNTGKNPYYACINSVSEEHLIMAELFSSRIVYFINPESVMTKAFISQCPAVALECGLPNKEDGINKVVKLLNDCLERKELPTQVQNRTNLEIYYSYAAIKVDQKLKIGFDESDKTLDICLNDNIEQMNFRRCKKGAVLGTTKNKEIKLKVFNDENDDVTAEYLVNDGNKIITIKEIIPAMFTKEIEIIYQDCLGYIMIPIEIVQ